MSFKEAISAGPEPVPAENRRNIDKINFMFHPVCWAIGMNGGEPPSGVDGEHYLACLEWEKQVNERQRQFISSMSENEALVISPISAKQPMLELEEHASSVLGDRCIIVGREAVNAPASWRDLPNPIERFLNDKTLDGRSDFLKDVPPDVQSELESEIREACDARGYNWDIAALKVVYYNRLTAMDIAKELENRGLSIDPKTVESIAFGEGFEQCAMTWKSMLIPYLGFSKPAENDFGLSVSGAKCLMGAAFRERVALTEDIRLFLWEGHDGRPIGLFARAWCRLKDPQSFARLPLDASSLQIWDLTAKRPPAEGPTLDIPVLNAIRRDPVDEPLYVIGNSLSFDAFRQILLDAEIIQQPATVED